MYRIAIEKIMNDGVGILPTDTLYGLVGRAFSRKAFERIFELKKRNKDKPFIILISSIKDLDLFDIKVDEETKKILERYWPGKVSIVLSCDSEKFSYLHLGTKTLAFRMPNKKNLLELLEKTGPLLAPSANRPGEKPAITIEEAKKYFGDSSPTTFVLKRLWRILFEADFYNFHKISLNLKKISKMFADSAKVVGDKVDFYVDEGKLESLPSTLIKIENGEIVVLREGAVKING